MVSLFALLLVLLLSNMLASGLRSDMAFIVRNLTFLISLVVSSYMISYGQTGGNKQPSESTIVIFNETIGQLTVLEKLKPFHMAKLMSGLRIEQVSLPKLYDGYFVDGGPIADGYSYVFHGSSDDMSKAVAKIIFRSRPLGVVSKLSFTDKDIVIESKDGTDGHAIRYRSEEIGYKIDPHHVITKRPAVGTRAASMDAPTLAEILNFPTKKESRYVKH